LHLLAWVISIKIVQLGGKFFSIYVLKALMLGAISICLTLLVFIYTTPYIRLFLTYCPRRILRFMRQDQR